MKKSCRWSFRQVVFLAASTSHINKFNHLFEAHKAYELYKLTITAV